MKPIPSKNLVKAAKIYTSILEIEREIIKIQDIALQAANDHCDISIDINLLNKSKEVVNHDDFKEEYGKMFFFGQSIHPALHGLRDEYNKNNKKSTFSFSESECLIFLNLLIKIKNNRREQYLNQLQKLGVTK